MSTPTSPSGATTQSNPTPPQLASNKASNRKLKNSIAYTSKLRSSGPMRNDTDTERIRLRLVSGGSAADLAEEGYRLCHMNAKLRGELAEAKRDVHAPLPTDNDTARIQARLDDGGTAKEIAEEAYRVCRVNAHLRKTASSVQADMREMRKKMAVKEDALSEMRSDYPEMHEVLQRIWGFLKNQNVKVPHDLRKAYEARMMPGGHDWQRYRSGKRDVRLTKEQADARKNKDKAEAQKKKEQTKGQGKDKAKGQAKGKGKAKEDEKKSEPEKTPFRLHMHNGKTYDLAKPLADQDSEAEDSDDPDVSVSKPDPPVFKKRKGDESDADVSDPSVSKPGRSGSKKRKAGHMEGPTAKRLKFIVIESEDDLAQVSLDLEGAKTKAEGKDVHLGAEKVERNKRLLALVKPREARRKSTDVEPNDEPEGLSSEVSDLSDLEDGEIQE
jgi:hypothetical protein